MDDDEGSCDVVKEAVSLSTCTFNKCITSQYRRFRLGSWNVQGLNSTRKQLELSEILVKNSIDILAVQESWEIVGKPSFRVPGYLWFGKPRCKEPKTDLQPLKNCSALSDINHIGVIEPILLLVALKNCSRTKKSS